MIDFLNSVYQYIYETKWLGVLVILTAAYGLLTEIEGWLNKLKEKNA